MKILKNGSDYQFYSDDLTILEELPKGTYCVRFSQSRGFYLESRVGLKVTERFFGDREAKIAKVLSAYSHFADILNRNLGVILSGSKGIGKSMFAKKLCSQAEEDYPVIVVDSYDNGIVEFLSGISQKVVILFDEFDKTFRDPNVQASFLSLFDGVIDSKKLFIITCNNLGNINEFLVNRPGRFHYHFRFDFLSGKEIREYMEANLDSSHFQNGTPDEFAAKVIDDVVKFGSKVRLNYDRLRAIVFEANRGLAFAEAIEDLNILDTEYERYDITVRFSCGMSLTSKGKAIDFFNDGTESVSLCWSDGYEYATMTFQPMDSHYNELDTDVIVVDAKDVTVEWEDEDDDDESHTSTLRKLKDSKITGILIKRRGEDQMRYNVCRNV